jgi:ABC-type taurine transport system substrate-binding protein
MIAVKQRRVFWASIAVLAGLLLLVVLYRRTTNESLDVNLDPPPNKAYSAYQYGVTNTVYVGTQPLYVPTGLITATMRRDPVLKEELRKLGLKITFYPYMKGHDVNVHLISGHLQAGIGGDMPTLIAAATTNIVIPVMVQSGPTWLVTRSSIMLKDLKGKRIAYAKGSNAHFMLLNLLSLEGFSESDVKLVPMDVNEMIDALESRTISAFAAWEPTPTIAIQTHRFVARFGGPSSGFMYFRREFADKHPAALRLIVAAVARAGRWLCDGSDAPRIKASGWTIEASETLTGAKLNLTPEKMASVSKRDVLGSRWTMSFAIPENDLLDNSQLKKEHAFLKTLDLLSEESLWEEIQASFDLTILPEILGNSHEYRLSEFRYPIQSPTNTLIDQSRKETQ